MNTHDPHQHVTLKELKSNLKENLKKSGVLNTVKAHIRKEFISNMYPGGRKSLQPSSNITPLFERALFSSIYHCFKARGMMNTLSVFIAESGINIQEINLAWINIDSIYLPKIISNLVTSFWIVALINAINWLDGIDGLASGIVGFASLGLTVISYQNGQFYVPLIAVTLSGCSFGFLRFNFYPAKILMGDSGSYFLGFSLAIVSIMSTSLEVNPIGIFIPFFLLIIPLMDMLIVIIRRLFKRESPFLSDRSHFHHQLIDSGFTELGTVILFYSLSQWIAVVTIGLASINDGVYLLATMLSSVILFFGFIISKYVL